MLGAAHRRPLRQLELWLRRLLPAQRYQAVAGELQGRARGGLRALWRFPISSVVPSWYVRIVRLIGSVSGFAHIVGDAPNDRRRILTVVIPDHSGVDSRENNTRVVARRLRNG